MAASILHPAARFIKVQAALSANPVDLAVIDLTLPDADGLDLTRLIRQKYKIGVIILSGRAETTDRILATAVNAQWRHASPLTQQPGIEETPGTAPDWAPDWAQDETGRAECGTVPFIDKSDAGGIDVESLRERIARGIHALPHAPEGEPVFARFVFIPLRHAS